MTIMCLLVSRQTDLQFLFEGFARWTRVTEKHSEECRLISRSLCTGKTKASRRIQAVISKLVGHAFRARHDLDISNRIGHRRVLSPNINHRCFR